MDYNISSRRFRPWGSRVMALSMKCDSLVLRAESREEWILRDVHRPTDRRPSAPQENQCLFSHFLTTLGTQEKTDCTSMLWSIMDNTHESTAVKTRCPLNRTTWPYCRLRCQPIEVEYFFEVIRRQVTVFKWSQAQVYFLKIHMIYVEFMSLRSRTIKILISN